jgi:hypothetical protein
VTAMIAPTTTASATGMPMVTAVRRLARLSCRRRHADRCLVGMQSTSVAIGNTLCSSCSRLETLDLTRAAYRQLLNS